MDAITLSTSKIETLLNDETISEILINGSESVFIEKEGNLLQSEGIFPNEEILKRYVYNLCQELGKKVDALSPFLDARLKNGSRVNIIIPPLSTKGSIITIRKFFNRKMSPQDFINNNMFTENTYKFLEKAVAEKKNIIVSGGTGSGKTTLLNLLGGLINRKERIITIEDSAELQINHDHVVSLECRNSNSEGIGLITSRDLLRNSLRMRPDRIIVGECRGNEVLDMLQAFNTGHPGSMTTIHSSSTREALGRLELMIALSESNITSTTAKMLIASTKALIVQLSRTSDGKRSVSEVSEITGLDANQILLKKVL